MQDVRLGLLKKALSTVLDSEGKDTGLTQIEAEFDGMRLTNGPHMENLDPEYDETIDQEKLRVYLYLGDEYGIIKQWDLTYVLQQSFVEPCRPVWQVRADAYNPNRSEQINVSGYAMRLRNSALELMRNRRGDPRDPEDSGLVIREVVAHDKGVSKLNQHHF